MINFNLNMMKWFTRLVTNNTGYSSKNWFLVVVTIVGIILLTVPAISLLVEVYYEHTIRTDLTGMAAYIGAVSSMFVTVGLTKVLGDRNERNNNKIGDKDNKDAY